MRKVHDATACVIYLFLEGSLKWLFDDFYIILGM